MAVPKLITAAIIDKLDKVLLIKRKGGAESGKWALPSGRGAFEKYSRPEDAVRQEVKFDLGQEFIIDYFYKYFSFENDGDPVVIFVFSGRLDQEPKINPQSVSEYRSFDEDEIDGLDMAFEHKKILKDYFYQQD